MADLGPMTSSDGAVYVTCIYCNQIGVVENPVCLPAEILLQGDVSELVKLAVGIIQDSRPENTPRFVTGHCQSCNRKETLALGVHNYAGEAERLKKAEEDRRRQQERAALDIQRLFRGRLGRRLAQSLRLEKQKRIRIQNIMARRLQFQFRKRLQRRANRTNLFLQVIKHASQRTFDYALSKERGLPKVFWYNGKYERELVFKDYRELVRRTGYRPPLYKVEANIREIAARILFRQDYLLTKVQAYWRGVLCRAFSRTLRAESIRLAEIHFMAAVKIQKWIRRHLALKEASALRRANLQKSVRHNYFKERRSKVIKRHEKELHIRLQKAYLESSRQLKAARTLGLVPYDSIDLNGSRRRYAPDGISSKHMDHVATKESHEYIGGSSMATDVASAELNDPRSCQHPIDRQVLRLAQQKMAQLQVRQSEEAYRINEAKKERDRLETLCRTNPVLKNYHKDRLESAKLSLPVIRLSRKERIAQWNKMSLRSSGSDRNPKSSNNPS